MGVMKSVKRDLRFGVGVGVGEEAGSCSDFQSTGQCAVFGPEAEFEKPNPESPVIFTAAGFNPSGLAGLPWSPATFIPSWSICKLPLAG